MKTQLKIILLPTLIMTCIFAISMIVIEFHQKTLLQERLEQELKALSSFSLSAVEMVNYGFTPEELDSSFDLLADQIAQASHYRISYFYINGMMLGDSKLDFDQVLLAENHSERSEIKDAILHEYGLSKRHSETLKQNMVYLAKYDPSTNFIARVSLPANTYEAAIINLRWSFSVIVIITIGMIVLFALIAIKFNERSLKKERDLQEKRIIERTQSLTLIQTMSTMLNASQSLDDAAHFLASILPQLLPKLSGAIYLGNLENNKAEKLIHWGERWPKEVAIFVSKQLEKDMKSTLSGTAVNPLNTIEQVTATELTISLSCSESFHGLMHLISEDDAIDLTSIDMIKKVAEQLGFALSNLKIKDQLRAQATRDPLTDLYNRRFMLEAFEQAINRAERHNTALGFIILDLDHFKEVNDEFGHDAGDEVLIQVANCLKSNLRMEDIACRYGGEEFCVICPDSNLKDSYALAEKIRRYISELSIDYLGEDLGHITISVGVSIFPNHALTINELISLADQALYKAKKNGRNKTEVVHSATSTLLSS